MKKDFRKLPKEFYIRSTITVAKELIGKVIYRKTQKNYLSGVIVETEAYLGTKDPASHAYGGKTKRNEVMFEEGGKSYVYFTYGNHFCFNVVTGKKNDGCAVLIRAAEPIGGIEVMKKNRNTDNIFNLTSGPGKFTRAFSIDNKLNGKNLLGDEIFICDGITDKKYQIAKSKRIGITKNTDSLYRFYMIDSPFVSRNSVNSKKNDRSK